MTLEPVTCFEQVFDGDTVQIEGRIDDVMTHVFKNIKLKRSRQDGREVILDSNKNWFFNFDMFLEGKSWVKSFSVVKQ